MHLPKQWKPEHFSLVEVEGTMLTNTPLRGIRTPDMPWEYYLLCNGYRPDLKRKTGLSRPIRFVHELCAPTEDELSDLLEEFMSRPNVKLLETTNAEGKTA